MLNAVCRVKLSITLPEIALPTLGLPAILPGDVAGLTALLHEQHSMYASAVESIRLQAIRAAQDFAPVPPGAIHPGTKPPNKQARQ